MKVQFVTHPRSEGSIPPFSNRVTSASDLKELILISAAKGLSAQLEFTIQLKNPPSIFQNNKQSGFHLHQWCFNPYPSSDFSFLTENTRGLTVCLLSWVPVCSLIFEIKTASTSEFFGSQLKLFLNCLFFFCLTHLVHTLSCAFMFGCFFFSYIAYHICSFTCLSLCKTFFNQSKKKKVKT